MWRAQPSDLSKFSASLSAGQTWKSEKRHFQVCDTQSLTHTMKQPLGVSGFHIGFVVYKTKLWIFTHAKAEAEQAAITSQCVFNEFDFSSVGLHLTGPNINRLAAAKRSSSECSLDYMLHTSGSFTSSKRLRIFNLRCTVKIDMLQLFRYAEMRQQWVCVTRKLGRLLSLEPWRWEKCGNMAMQSNREKRPSRNRLAYKLREQFTLCAVHVCIASMPNVPTLFNCVQFAPVSSQAEIVLLVAPKQPISSDSILKRLLAIQFLLSFYAIFGISTH